MDIKMTLDGKPIGELQSITVGESHDLPVTKHVITNIEENEITIGTYWDDKLVKSTVYPGDTTHLSSDVRIGTEVTIETSSSKENS